MWNHRFCRNSFRQWFTLSLQVWPTMWVELPINTKGSWIARHGFHKKGCYVTGNLDLDKRPWATSWHLRRLLLTKPCQWPVQQILWETELHGAQIHAKDLLAIQGTWHPAVCSHDVDRPRTPHLHQMEKSRIELLLPGRGGWVGPTWWSGNLNPA